MDTDGDKATVELGSDGIIYLVWKPRLRIEAEDARAAMAAVNELAGDLEYPMLVDMATTANVTPGAQFSSFPVPQTASPFLDQVPWTG